VVDVGSAKAEYSSSRVSMARYMRLVLFMIEQRWNYVIDKEMERDGLTTKQFLMLLIIQRLFRSPPSIREVADAMSMTHQNVKQVAANMERRGFLTLERDEKNRRIIRLKVTEQCRVFWEKRAVDDIPSVLALFENLSDDEMKALFDLMTKVEQKAEQLYADARAAKLGQDKESETNEDHENR